MSEDYQDSGEVTEAAAPEASGEMESHGEESREQYVPLDALQAERAERQKLQDELKMMRDNMQLFMRQQQLQSKSEPAQESISDDDVMTFGEFKKALQREKQQVEMTMNELRMTQKYPDYQEVITKYLPEVLNQRPELRDSLAKTQDYELAYYLAKNSDSYRESNKKSKKSEDAERIIRNAQSAGSPSSTGRVSPISQAKRYRDMSDAEFMKLANRNLGHF